jgi:hypothetical protein
MRTMNDPSHAIADSRSIQPTCIHMNRGSKHTLIGGLGMSDRNMMRIVRVIRSDIALAL